MKQPTEADFDVEVDDAGVHVLFMPTESHYDYPVLADGGLFSHRPFGTPRPAILATMFRPTSKPWPMKWPRPTIDLGSSVHSLCAPRSACA